MPILTAGYGNRGFAGFVELMKRHGVTHVVDVRSVPQSSYWEDFRRPRLERILPETGLRYVYMGDTLGGTPITTPQLAWEDATDGENDRRSPIFCKADPGSIDLDPLFKEPKFSLGLTKLVEAMSVSERTLCLMCGCLRPHRCHRSRLIGPALEALGVEVLHLDDKGEPVTQRQVDSEAEPLQSTLFS